MKVVVDKVRKTIGFDDLPEVVVGLHELVAFDGVRNVIGRLEGLVDECPKLNPELILELVKEGGFTASALTNQAISQVSEAISSRVVALGVSVAMEAIEGFTECTEWNRPYWMAVIEPLRSAGLSAQEILIKLQYD